TNSRAVRPDGNEGDGRARGRAGRGSAFRLFYLGRSSRRIQTMERKGRFRTSLFARMSLLFGLLVAVPLAVSGLILTLVGHHSIISSGEAMQNIGEQAVHKTKERLVRDLE